MTNSILLSRFAAALTLQLGFLSMVGAQDSTRVKEPIGEQTKNCWRGKPHPACNQFLLTEFGIYYRVVRPTQASNLIGSVQAPPFLYETRIPPVLATLEIGGLRNVGKHAALGLSLVFGVDELDDDNIKPTKGAKLRYRHWLDSNGNAIDVGAGFESRREPVERGARSRSGFTSDIAFNASDRIALVLRYDHMRLSGRTKPALSLGVRGGAQGGFFSALGVVATWATILVVHSQSSGNS